MRNVLQSKSKTLNVTPSKVTQPEYQHVGLQEPAVVSVVDVDLTKRIEINLETLDALLEELACICVDAIVVRYASHHREEFVYTASVGRSGKARTINGAVSLTELPIFKTMCKAL